MDHGRRSAASRDVRCRRAALAGRLASGKPVTILQPDPPVAVRNRKPKLAALRIPCPPPRP